MTVAAQEALFLRLAVIAPTMAREGPPEPTDDNATIVRHQGQERSSMASWIRDGTIIRAQLCFLGYTIWYDAEADSVSTDNTPDAVAPDANEKDILNAAAFFLRHSGIRDRYTQFLLQRIIGLLNSSDTRRIQDNDKTTVADYSGDTVISEQKPEPQESTTVETVSFGKRAPLSEPEPEQQQEKHLPIPIWALITLALLFIGATIFIWWLL